DRRVFPDRVVVLSPQPEAPLMGVALSSPRRRRTLSQVLAAAAHTRGGAKGAGLSACGPAPKFSTSRSGTFPKGDARTAGWWTSRKVEMSPLAEALAALRRLSS